MNYLWICHRVEMSQQKWWIFDDKLERTREDLVETQKTASKARTRIYLFELIRRERSMCFVAAMTESISVHEMCLLSNYFRKLVQIRALKMVEISHSWVVCAVSSAEARVPSGNITHFQCLFVSINFCVYLRNSAIKLFNDISVFIN